MKKLILATLLLAGCSGKPFAAFVINQDAHSQSKPGKSYSCEPCQLQSQKGTIRLECGQRGQTFLQLEVSTSLPLASLLGQTLPLQSGEVEIPGSQLKLENGKFTLQTLSGGIARGNFSGRVQNQKPPWEVVGSFEASVSAP